jgi:hypothetical protein
MSDCGRKRPGRFWEESGPLSGRQPPLPEKMISDHAEPDEQAKYRADEK